VHALTTSTWINKTQYKSQ